MKSPATKTRTVTIPAYPALRQSLCGMSIDDVHLTVRLLMFLYVFIAEEREGGRGKQSRAEKKCRKAIAKHPMKPVPGIMRVQLRKSKNVSLSHLHVCS